MNVSVTMASGEVDDWEEVADAIDDRGCILVLDHIDSDEVPGSMKVLEISREVEQEGAPPMTKTTTYQVLCQYAPGMWIKVEFDQ
jgi:hypothetical protein